MKIVINTCFGGFSLSHEAVLRYAQLKGWTLYPEKGKYGFWVYWKVPPAERIESIQGKQFYALSMDERMEQNRRYDEQTASERDIPRDDPALVAVVEEMGTAAYGGCARLTVVEIPDDVKWQVEEYDGNEHIAEVHRTWP